MKDKILLCLVLGSFAMTGCTDDKRSNLMGGASKKGSNDGNSQFVRPDDGANTSIDTSIESGLEAAQAGTKWDYPAEYCKHLDKLKLRIDLEEEKRVFCVDGLPTKVFLEQREEILNSDYGAFKVRELMPAEFVDEFSEFRLIWGFRVPIRPFDVKEKPIYEYVSLPIKTDLVNLKPEWTKLPRETLDSSGLHLWSTNIDYTLNVNAAPGVVLYNYRQAQYNMYQLMAASEEMGFGLEHLAKPDPEHYLIYNVLNVVLNDGTGYNDGKGGSVIIGYLHAKVNNQNYPAISIEAIIDIVNRVSTNLATGLMK